MVTQFSLGKIAVTSHLGTRPATRRAASWRIAMLAAIVGFFLRALVPLGFMPDARALQAGHIELTLCSPSTAGSARAVSTRFPADAADAVSSSGPAREGTYRLTLGSTDHSPDSMAKQVDCPFGLMAAQGVMGPPEARAAFASTAHPHHIPRAQDSFLGLLTSGPPLGSRAPPGFA